MYVSTEDIVKKIAPNLKLTSVLFEAITNSIQAKATTIDVIFETTPLGQNSLLNDTVNIKSVIIKDNGIGFNDKNLNSFNHYMSKLKKELGCKGIGRFTYLVISEKVLIKSFNNNDTINFLFNLETDLLEPKRKEGIEKKETEVKLLNIRDRSISSDLSEELKEIKNHFISIFMFAEKEKNKITINLYKDDEKVHTINSLEEGKGFTSESFKIGKENFKVHYKKRGTRIKGFYCADSRVVKEDDLNINLSFKNGDGLLFFISSPFFDSKVNDIRNGFNIKDANSSLLDKSLNWDTINRFIYSNIDTICKKYNINIDEKTEKNKKESLKSAPYLAYYIDKTINKSSSATMIREAKESFEKDKEYIRDIRNRSKDDYEKKLYISTQAELAEYIYDRQKIIDKLKKFTDEKVLEKEIHNLFMKQNTSDKEANYKSNNLWLFDDRFMSYDKVFSENQIKEIFPKLNKNIDRPDILSIVSNTYEKEKITDIVIIELKKPDDKITPARAEEQLIDYASYVNSTREDNKIRVWTYAFLKFNDEIENKLKRKSYNKIPTQSKYPIYYKYWEEPNTIINFLDYTALAYDAETRNKTFINILKGKTIKKNK